MTDSTDRLRRFFGREALALDGRTLDGAPWGARGGLVETAPAPSDDALDAQGQVALLVAGDLALRVDTSAPHRVTTAAGDEVCATLDALEPRLLPKLRHLPAHIDEARQLVAATRYDEAERALQRLRRLVALSFVDHRTWEAFNAAYDIADLDNLYGICALRLGRPDEAEQVWRDAIERSGGARLNLADLYLATQRDDDLDQLAGTQPPLRIENRAADRDYVRICCALAAARRNDDAAISHWRAQLESPLGQRERTLIDEYPELAGRAGLDATD